ncbi:MAG: hypothetical protein U0075_14885 [Thermomicrobiales bacterium]
MSARAVAASRSGLLIWAAWTFRPVYTSYADLLGDAHPGGG